MGPIADITTFCLQKHCTADYDYKTAKPSTSSYSGYYTPSGVLRTHGDYSKSIDVDALLKDSESEDELECTCNYLRTQAFLSVFCCLQLSKCARVTIKEPAYAMVCICVSTIVVVVSIHKQIDVKRQPTRITYASINEVTIIPLSLRFHSLPVLW